MSHPELLDIEGDFHGAGRLRASVAYDDRNVGRFRLVRVAVPHDFDGGPDGFKSSGCGVYQVKPVLVLDGYAVGANVEVEVRHGRQCHASQAVALTYERGRPPTFLPRSRSFRTRRSAPSFALIRASPTSSGARRSSMRRCFGSGSSMSAAAMLMPGSRTSFVRSMCASGQSAWWRGKLTSCRSRRPSSPTPPASRQSM